MSKTINYKEHENKQRHQQLSVNKIQRRQKEVVEEENNNLISRVKHKNKIMSLSFSPSLSGQTVTSTGESRLVGSGTTYHQKNSVAVHRCRKSCLSKPIIKTSHSRIFSMKTCLLILQHLQQHVIALSIASKSF